MKKTMAKRRSKRNLPDLRMGSAEFDRIMGKALAVAPEPKKDESNRNRQRKG